MYLPVEPGRLIEGPVDRGPENRGCTVSVSKNYPKVYCDTKHLLFVLCLFCLEANFLVRQNNYWSYFAFNWTRLVEGVTWQVWNSCPA